MKGSRGIGSSDEVLGRQRVVQSGTDGNLALHDGKEIAPRKQAALSSEIRGQILRSSRNPGEVEWQQVVGHGSRRVSHVEPIAKLKPRDRSRWFRVRVGSAGLATEHGQEVNDGCPLFRHVYVPEGPGQAARYETPRRRPLDR